MLRCFQSKMERFTNNPNPLHDSFSEHTVKKKKKKNTAEETEAPAPGEHNVLSSAGRCLFYFLLLVFNKQHMNKQTTDTLERGRGEVPVSDL